MMHDDEYRQTLETLGSITATIRLLDLVGALEAVNLLETLGPIVAPTEYNNGGAKRLADHSALLTAALGLQRAADAIVRAAGGDAVTDARDRAKS